MADNKFTGMDGYKVRNSPNMGRFGEPYTIENVISLRVSAVDQAAGTEQSPAALGKAVFIDCELRA